MGQPPPPAGEAAMGAQAGRTGSSVCMAVARTSSTFESPGVNCIVSGKAMEKNLLSGSLYLIRTAPLETFLTTSCLVYSPPGCQPGAHVSPSPQSTPKRRMRSMRPSGAGLRLETSFDGLPAGQEAGSPLSRADGFMPMPDMLGAAQSAARHLGRAQTRQAQHRQRAGELSEATHNATMDHRYETFARKRAGLSLES